MLSYILWKSMSFFASLNLVQVKTFYLKFLVLCDKTGLLKKIFGLPVSQPVKVMNMHFMNPLGLGAGFDVNGDFVNTLAKLGFGFLEFGTVTPHAQICNQSNTQIKLYPQEKSIISCDADQNMGVDYLVNNLENCSYKGIIGIQINKNNITPDKNIVDDLQYCMRRVIKVANYVAIQVPESIVKDHSALDEFFGRLKATQAHLHGLYELYLSIVVKVPLSIEYHDLKNLVRCAIKYKIDALNTCYPKHTLLPIEGRLFGYAIQKHATKIQNKMAELVANKLPIIASGGIITKLDAVNRMRDGAKLVQIYSGFFFSGPKFIKELVTDLKN